MRDGRTRELKAAARNAGLSGFLSKFQPSIVVLSGSAKGTEYAIGSERVSMGRGPGVDLAFDDSAMSREHAALEFAGDGFRLRDLASTNGTLLNGGEIKVAGIKHGDRFQLGELLFQFVVEERQREPAPHVITDD